MNLKPILELIMGDVKFYKRSPKNSFRFVYEQAKIIITIILKYINSLV